MSCSGTEELIQWMIQKGLIGSAAQTMDLEKVQVTGAELLSSAGTGSKKAFQYIPVVGVLCAFLQKI